MKPAPASNRIQMKSTRYAAGLDSQFPNQWQNATTNDTAPNDDLCWTAIAFARAFSATGNTNWLNQAETAFNVVWARAQVGGDAGNNGLTAVQPPSTNVSSAVNYGCIVAAHWLAREVPTQAAFYNNCASSVYTFCAGKGNLYNASTGKVRDSLTGPIDYTYNYGIALQAAVSQGDKTACRNMAQYLANSFVGYGPNAYTNNGTWSDGTNTYDVLPYYGNPVEPHWKNDAGYDGVCFRGLGCAIAAGDLTSWQEQWARENVEAAFHYRNVTNRLMWGNWQAPTPASDPYPYLYSWDCSCAVSGILDIPLPAIRPLPQPVINSCFPDGSSLLFSGTNGYTGGGYYVLTSTNISLPPGNWIKVLTNSFAAGGSFSITNPMFPGVPAKFYILELQ